MGFQVLCYAEDTNASAYRTFVRPAHDSMRRSVLAPDAMNLQNLAAVQAVM